MKRLDTFVAFGLGCLATLFVARLGPRLHAQGNSDTSDTVHVCVAPDGVMKLAELYASCPDGQKSLLLKKKTVDADVPKPPDEKSRACADTMDKRELDDFERRLKTLENPQDRHLVGNRIVAPFEVVDRAGKRLFYVDGDQGALPRRAELYNSGGNIVAVIGALNGGGQFVATTPSRNLSVYTGIYKDGKAAGVNVLEGATTRIDFGKDAAMGHYRLKFFEKSGQWVAGIGQEPTSGAGLAMVNDAAGKPRAAMGVLGGAQAGKGAVYVANDSQIVVAQMREGDYGGGLLRIDNAEGAEMVAAGVEKDGYGVVSTGPQAFKPGLGLFGLPGSYIAGKTK